MIIKRAIRGHNNNNNNYSCHVVEMWAYSVIYIEICIRLRQQTEGGFD